MALVLPGVVRRTATGGASLDAVRAGWTHASAGFSARQHAGIRCLAKDGATRAVGHGEQRPNSHMPTVRQTSAPPSAPLVRNCPNATDSRPSALLSRAFVAESHKVATADVSWGKGYGVMARTLRPSSESRSEFRSNELVTFRRNLRLEAYQGERWTGPRASKTRRHGKEMAPALRPAILPHWDAISAEAQAGCVATGAACASADRAPISVLLHRGRHLVGSGGRCRGATSRASERCDDFTRPL